MSIVCSQLNSSDNVVDGGISSEVPTLLETEGSSLTIPFDNGASNDNIITIQNEKIANQELKLVPVTILTGFLGSGKTTLLKFILKSNNLGRRIAIIENEFSGMKSELDSIPTGALNIESLIVRDGVNRENISDLIELPNGCICCTVKDSLVTTLETLLRKKKNDIDYIIIECSGMANPGPIASVLWLDDALQSNLVLDGIVTMVDARNFEMQIGETSWFMNDKNVNRGELMEQRGDEAAQQVAYADRIIINKVDHLYHEDEGMITRKVDSIKGVIRAINRTAPIRVTTFSEIHDLNWLIDTRSFSMERFSEKHIAPSVTDRCACCSSYCGICSHIDNMPDITREPTHGHSSTIKTVVLTHEGSAYLPKLHSWLATILWPDQDKPSTLSTYFEAKEQSVAVADKDDYMKIFRIKGVLSIKFHITTDFGQFHEEDLVHIHEGRVDKRRYIVQAVNDVWDIQPASTDLCWENDCVRLCTIVIIGRFLDEKILRTGYLSCFQSD
jgi:G3E family GTPase